MKFLTQEQQSELQEALCHMHVAELKELLGALQLSSQGFNKKELVDRLVHYAATGQQLPPLTIPVIAQAARGKVYPLDARTLMLHGNYKNDAVTRQFFKQIIGTHFHYTAQGVDWLRERWLAGNPPTYAEFAQEWQRAYDENKQHKRAPKQEWAYIRFTQEYLQKHPVATKHDAITAWEIQRKNYKQKAITLLMERC